MANEKLPPCPFCGGKVIYSELNKEIRQPDMIQCIGECFFEIMCSSGDSDTKKGDALRWYMKDFPEIKGE